MSRVAPCALPASALLQRYHGGPHYADCFCIDVAAVVSQAAFVEAFYTTPLFKCERLLLAIFAARPSSDADARQLATGMATTFAAWQVEDRDDRQLLLADFTGRTRSWLMAAPHEGGTRLHFGSAVMSRSAPAGGRCVSPDGDRTGASGLKPLPQTAVTDIGGGFNALLGFHKLYSRLLLGAAAARLRSVG